MYNADKNEKEVLSYWDEHKIFEKSVEMRPENKPYVFYDGPPFATGLPHYGHLVANTMKDVVPRFWTMRGFRVERKWGWDCHGLPIENIIEKDLDLKTKKDIEDYGLRNFNNACRGTVLKYAEEWKKVIHRLGRFVDMENSYRTMDIGFMESVWWVFRQLWDKKLIYEGKKPMHICPRCETPLSNFEVSQNYIDIKDLSVTAAFKVKDASKVSLDKDLYILAWTTTPWTLPGNMLLAVGADIDYLIIKVLDDERPELQNKLFVVAKERADYVVKSAYEVVKEVNGTDLLGLTYEPLFPYFADSQNAFRVVIADFVTTVDGTGVVHIAPAFGTDDYHLGEREGVPFVQHVGMDGKFTEDVIDYAGMSVKSKEDHTSADVEIVKWLAAHGNLFNKEKYLHSYPHCWRCDTPLLNYLTSSWFVRVTEIKDQLLQNNEKINWVPEHIKYGRFGDWLENVKDWAISRNRFWGAPLPVWKSEDGKDVICVGSVEELENLSGKSVEDLHKDTVDEITFEKDGKTYKRIPEVLDCWFESGSMPYGQMHYPFQNKEKFEAGFPAEFIAEGQDQTRGWFYTLHVLSTALTMGDNPSIPGDECLPAFRNVIVNGIVLAEDGKKMSKRLKNYPDPMEVINKYGSDALRFYLMSSPVVHAENLNFSENGVREVYSKLINTLHNVFAFYEMFANEMEINYGLVSDNVLDKWIVAKLNKLIVEVTEKMEQYKLAEATRPIQDFVTDLSQWYVRRSRDRFKGDDEKDKQKAISTLHNVLLNLVKVIAPFTPFIAEDIYLKIKGEKGKQSVHLEDWPEALEADVDTEVLENMEKVRNLVEFGLSLRSESGVKVRQPLSQFYYKVEEKLDNNLEQIIADELNVKEVIFGENESVKVKESGVLKVGLDTEITEELKNEGLVRDLVRAINQMRKEQGLTRENKIKVTYHTEDYLLQDIFIKFADEIKSNVLAEELIQDSAENEIDLGEHKVWLGIKQA